MIRTDDDSLMMIEPEYHGDVDSINDELTQIAIDVFNKCKTGNAYKGCHKCKCGKYSDNYDYYTPKGLLTNSLLVHYVQHHRDEIPRSEIAKLLLEKY